MVARSAKEGRYYTALAAGNFFRQVLQAFLSDYKAGRIR